MLTKDISDISSLFSKFSLKKFKKGTQILKQGESVEHFYYLEKGICYISAITRDGSENILCYFKKGTFPGICPALISSSHQDLRIVAKTDCELYVITKEEFKVLFEKHPEFTWSVLNVVMKQMDNILKQYHRRGNLNVTSRICQGLLDLSHKEVINGKEVYIVDKSFSQNEISKYVGIHYTTLSLTLKKLRELGIIEKGIRGIYIYDKKKLEHYALTEELSYKDCREVGAR